MKNVEVLNAHNDAQNNTDESSKEIIMNHLSSFIDNHLEGVMSDYTDDSVLITRDGTYKGLKNIEGFFINLMTHFPKERSTLELDKITTIGRLAYIIWHAKTPSLEVALGSDTYIIKDGKIYEQTFVGQMRFLN